MTLLTSTANRLETSSDKDAFDRVSEALEVDINKAGDMVMGAAYEGATSPFAEGQLVVLYRLRWSLLGIEPPDAYHYAKGEDSTL